MGTRGLTMVISKKKTKVAQYGQWDHYPKGQGATILKFLKTTNLDEFRKVVDKLRFATKKDEKEMDTFHKSIGVTDGWMNMEQSELYQKKYLHLSRDAGAGILNLIMGKPIPRYDPNLKKDVDVYTEPVFLSDSSDFAGESLHCEWAYVIDLDKNKLEVYKGFNKKPLGKTQRFYFLQKLDNDKTGRPSDSYYPVRLLKKYDLDKLPNESEFCNELKPKK